MELLHVALLHNGKCFAKTRTIQTACIEKGYMSFRPTPFQPLQFQPLQFQPITLSTVLTFNRWPFRPLANSTACKFNRHKFDLFN